MKFLADLFKELSKYKFTQLHIKDEYNNTQIHHSDIKIEEMTEEEISYVQRALYVF